MKLLFTHSYFIALDPKQKRAGKPYPPLAPLYAAALLRENNYAVAFADLQFGVAEDLRQHLQSEKPDVLVIYDDGFNYLVKMCLSNMRQAVFKMIQIAGEFQIPVIISSSDASDNHALYFNQGIQYLIEGEAEYTLLELLQQFKSGDLTRVKGLVYKQEDVLVKNPARSVSRQLDDLPVPAWDLIDFSIYGKWWGKSAGYFSVNLVTTRGCPYKCNWCAKPIYGNRYNSHSASRVVKEMQLLKQMADIDHIWFADDIFGLKPNFLEDFVEALTVARLMIPFKIQSRADLMANEKTVRLLAVAGCTEVWLGVESGSQRILDAMDKGITLSQIKTARQLLKKHGIRVGFFMQFGYRGETISDIQLSLELLKKLQPDDLGVSVSYPLPGTLFYEQVREELTETKNWAHSDDLLHLFKGTYSPVFYKVLQKYTHYLFRTAQAGRTLTQLQINKKSVLLPYYLVRKKILRRRLKDIFSKQDNLAFPL